MARNAMPAVIDRRQRGLKLVADRADLTVATGSKPAARWRMKQIGRVSGNGVDHMALPVYVRKGMDQLFGIRMDGFFDDLLCNAGFHDFTRIHHCNPVTGFRYDG